MTREEAIKILTETQVVYFAPNGKEKVQEALDMAIEALSAEPSGDLISRVDAFEAVCGVIMDEFDVSPTYGYEVAEKALSALPSADTMSIEEHQQIVTELKQSYNSADAAQGWRTDKPTKQGEYMVTVVSMRHGMVELMYYGKPIMPNCKVRGKCWYRSDDEWGDVVYDDTDILAWMPLPKPYKGGDDHEDNT